MSDVHTIKAVATSSRWVRISAVLTVAILVGYRLPLLQAWLGRGADLVDFDGPFEAGNERVVTVGPTVVVWFCALTAPLAVSLVTAMFDAGIQARLLAAAAAAAGVVYARQDLEDSVASELRAATGSAALVGMALGLVVAVLVARSPKVGTGVVVHAGVLWLLAVLLPDALLYAGTVSLRWPSVGDLLLVMSVLLAASGWLAYRVVLRGGRRLVGLACGAVGPTMAAVVYPVSPYQHVLWDENAGSIAATVAVSAVVVAWTAAVLAKARVGKTELVPDTA